MEESILGWEELELEVVRDANNNMITVCFIENIDPLGVHTGDSFCSAPMLTISEECTETAAGAGLQDCGIRRGHRRNERTVCPRSRLPTVLSSSRSIPVPPVLPLWLPRPPASPSPWYPPCWPAGLTLNDIPCGKYGTLDKYVPDGDYVVIKFARWAFEKFKGVEDKLGTQMRAVGEVMSIGKTYKEAFQKAIRSLETGRYGLGYAKNFDELSKEELLTAAGYPVQRAPFHHV